MENKTLLNSSLDLFKKLQYDYHAFEANFDSRYKALDCASSGWHLLDWVYNLEEAGNYNNIGTLRKDFEARCSELSVLHDIVTGGKHFTISQSRSNMLGGSVQLQDMYTDTYRDSYDTDVLMIEFSDREPESFLHIIDAVVIFWKKYFQEKGLL